MQDGSSPAAHSVGWRDAEWMPFRGWVKIYLLDLYRFAWRQ
jgi:hypothetical protein